MHMHSMIEHIADQGEKIATVELAARLLVLERAPFRCWGKRASAVRTSGYTAWTARPTDLKTNQHYTLVAKGARV